MIKQINHINGTSSELSDVLELAFAGMLAHYGQEALNEIYVAFLKTRFVVASTKDEEEKAKCMETAKQLVKKYLDVTDEDN